MFHDIPNQGLFCLHSLAPETVIVPLRSAVFPNIPSAGPEELDTPVTMTSDLSQITPRRPRAATAGLPAMGPPSPDSRRSVHGSPPLGSVEPTITSTAQGSSRCHLERAAPSIQD